MNDVSLQGRRKWWVVKFTSLIRFAFAYVSHAWGSKINIPPGSSTPYTRRKNAFKPSSPPLRCIHLDIEKLDKDNQHKDWGKARYILRHNNIVAISIFRNLRDGPICHSKGYIVWKHMFASVLWWWYRKRPKLMFAGDGKVVRLDEIIGFGSFWFWRGPSSFL